MVVIDIPMPEHCMTCDASSECLYEYGTRIFRRSFCINGRDITDFKYSRPDWCPMAEVEEAKIKMRTSHTTWEEKTVYVRKDNAEKKRGV